MNKKKTECCSGFSLIELLVTISIVSLFLALLVVGIQVAREAARRSKCSANLKQVALAIQMYHDTHKAMPALTTTYKLYNAAEKTETETLIGTCGAQIFLLPYLEQQQVYDGFEEFASLERTKPNLVQISVNEPFPPTYPNVYTQGVHPRHWGANVVIPVFACPSDSESGVIESPAREYDHFQREGFFFDYTDWQFCRTNLMFSTGDAPMYNSGIDTPAAKRGPFTPHSWKSFSRVTDGLSNTLCLAESISGPPTDYLAYLEGRSRFISTSNRDVAAAPDACNPELMMVWPSICLESVSKADPLRLNQVEPWGERGTYWFSGRPLANGFSTNLPPNSVTCSFGEGAFGSVLGGVSSFHPSGANVAMMDGSVRFIKNEIDTGNLFAPRSRILETNQAVEGKSTYGVWGALGSINGGENSSL